MLNLIHLRIAIASWSRKLKRAYDNLIAQLKQVRKDLHRSFLQEQQDINQQIHEILVNLRDWQRRALRKAIASLYKILSTGTDRAIELGLCEIANVITHWASLGTLHQIRGKHGHLAAYSYLSDRQEALIWQFIAAFKKWFGLGTKVVKEAIADLNATLDIEEPVASEVGPSTLREDAISWAIAQVGEVIRRWMPGLLPTFHTLAPFSPAQSWDDWEASVWRAVSKFRRWVRC